MVTTRLAAKRPPPTRSPSPKTNLLDPTVPPRTLNASQLREILRLHAVPIKKPRSKFSLMQQYEQLLAKQPKRPNPGLKRQRSLRAQSEPSQHKVPASTTSIPARHHTLPPPTAPIDTAPHSTPSSPRLSASHVHHPSPSPAQGNPTTGKRKPTNRLPKITLTVQNLREHLTRAEIPFRKSWNKSRLLKIYKARVAPSIINQPNKRNAEGRRQGPVSNSSSDDGDQCLRVPTRRRPLSFRPAAPSDAIRCRSKFVCVLIPRLVKDLPHRRPGSRAHSVHHGPAATPRDEIQSPPPRQSPQAVPSSPVLHTDACHHPARPGSPTRHKPLPHEASPPPDAPPQSSPSGSTHESSLRSRQTSDRPPNLTPSPPALSPLSPLEDPEVLITRTTNRPANSPTDQSPFAALRTSTPPSRNPADLSDRSSSQDSLPGDKQSSSGSYDVSVLDEGQTLAERPDSPDISSRDSSQESPPGHKQLPSGSDNVSGLDERQTSAEPPESPVSIPPPHKEATPSGVDPLDHGDNPAAASSSPAQPLNALHAPSAQPNAPSDSADGQPSNRPKRKRTHHQPSTNLSASQLRNILIAHQVKVRPCWKRSQLSQLYNQFVVPKLIDPPNKRAQPSHPRTSPSISDSDEGPSLKVRRRPRQSGSRQSAFEREDQLQEPRAPRSLVPPPSSAAPNNEDPRQFQRRDYTPDQGQPSNSIEPDSPPCLPPSVPDAAAEAPGLATSLRRPHHDSSQEDPLEELRAPPSSDSAPPSLPAILEDPCPIRSPEGPPDHGHSPDLIDLHTPPRVPPPDLQDALKENDCTAPLQRPSHGSSQSSESATSESVQPATNEKGKQVAISPCSSHGDASKLDKRKRQHKLPPRNLSLKELQKLLTAHQISFRPTWKRPLLSKLYEQFVIPKLIDPPNKRQAGKPRSPPETSNSSDEFDKAQIKPRRRLRSSRNSPPALEPALMLPGSKSSRHPSAPDDTISLPHPLRNSNPVVTPEVDTSGDLIDLHSPPCGASSGQQSTLDRICPSISPQQSVHDFLHESPSTSALLGSSLIPVTSSPAVEAASNSLEIQYQLTPSDASHAPSDELLPRQNHESDNQHTRISSWSANTRPPRRRGIIPSRSPQCSAGGRVQQSPGYTDGFGDTQAAQDNGQPSSEAFSGSGFQSAVLSAIESARSDAANMSEQIIDHFGMLVEGIDQVKNTLARRMGQEIHGSDIPNRPSTSNAPTSEAAPSAPRSGPLRAIRKHVATLFGQKDDTKLPPPASPASKALWTLPDRVDRNSPTSDASSEPAVIGGADPCFPYPGGPGHRDSTPQALKIIFCMMKDRGVNSFRPNLREPITSAENNFLWTLALDTFIELIKVGEYPEISLDIHDRKCIREALHRHVTGRLQQRFLEEQEWTTERRLAQTKSISATTRKAQLLRARIGYLLTVVALRGLIPIVKESCSDDESDNGSDDGADDAEAAPVASTSGAKSKAKRCQVRCLPWRSSKLTQIMDLIDEARLQQLDSVPKKRPGRQPRVRRRPSKPITSNLPAPKSLPRDCYDIVWLKSLSKLQLLSLKIGRKETLDKYLAVLKTP